MDIEDREILDASITTIQAGELLDLSLAAQIFSACEWARGPAALMIVIDLSRTIQIMDSGIAMLKILNLCTQSQVRTISFVNCSCSVRKMLTERGVAEGHACSDELRDM